MVHLGEAFFGFASDALGGRVGSHQFRMVGFEPTQLAHFSVVLGVRDLRRIEHVILIFVVAELFAQLLDSLFGSSWLPLVQIGLRT